VGSTISREKIGIITEDEKKKKSATARGAAGQNAFKEGGPSVRSMCLK